MSDLDIRALRGDRSRAEFGKELGVTALTVYRWELPPESAEARRPRGKVLQRLRDWMAQNASAQADTQPAPTPAQMPAPDIQLSSSEWSLLSPLLAEVESCELERAEAQWVGLLSSLRLTSEPARALALTALAKLQLLARHDTRGAFTTLLGVGPDPRVLPREVQLQYHLVSALLHAHPDARLFNAGKTHHHVAQARALLGEGEGDARFLLWFAEAMAGVALFETTLIARAMESFADVRELATTPLNRALVLEAQALAAMSRTDLGEAARCIDAYGAYVAQRPLPLQRMRALIWRVDMLVEEAAPPEEVLPLLDEAAQVQHRHRIAHGMHSMLMTRNRGELLLRLGRLEEAEAALQEAEQIGAALSYTPIRIHATLARLYHQRGQVERVQQLAAKAAAAEDLQRGLTRACGALLASVASLGEGDSAGAQVDAALQALGELERLRIWPVVHRQLALHALSVATLTADVAQAERLLPVCERIVEASPSQTGSAVFRRCAGTLSLRRGRLVEARQALETALATLTLGGNIPESALIRRLLANLALLEKAPDAETRLAQTEAELKALGLAVPGVLKPEAARRQPSVSTPTSQVSALVVPIQRLSLRGATTAMLEQELLNVVREVIPGRALKLEALPDTQAAAAGAGFEWHELSDGLGRRLRLGVAGPLGEPERSALKVLLACASLAFEVARLRGFDQVRTRKDERAEPEPETAVLPHVIAASPSMRRLKSELTRLSGSRATIILTGESGTGKEVVARAIHDLSQRADRPYVTFNSAAVPRELFEGQLFGYRKGAFTGATADHPGVIRAADGGTLFLDEVGELPLDVQPKLLRFLENGEVFPLGVQKPVEVDVRVIAATHRDLLQLVREKKFREDLYYRLQVVPVHLAPLRERKEDVLALARHFLRKLTPAGRETPILTPDGEARLVAHHWPGNVRELRNVIERSLAFEPLPSHLGAEQLVL